MKIYSRNYSNAKKKEYVPDCGIREVEKYCTYCSECAYYRRQMSADINANSESHKKIQREYNKSLKGKTSQKKYAQSEKGKIARRRADKKWRDKNRRKQDDNNNK